MKKSLTALVVAAGSVVAISGSATASSPQRTGMNDKNIVRVAASNPQFSTLVPPSLAKAPAPTQSILQLAAANPDFSTLVSLVQKAGLVQALSGSGPFTIFAPTNEAFQKLATAAPATYEAVLANPALLTKVL